MISPCISSQQRSGALVRTFRTTLDRISEGRAARSLFLADRLVACAACSTERRQYQPAMRSKRTSGLACRRRVVAVTCRGLVAGAAATQSTRALRMPMPAAVAMLALSRGPHRPWWRQATFRLALMVVLIVVLNAACAAVACTSRADSTPLLLARSMRTAAAIAPKVAAATATATATVAAGSAPTRAVRTVAATLLKLAFAVCLRTSLTTSVFPSSTKVASPAATTEQIAATTAALRTALSVAVARADSKHALTGSPMTTAVAAPHAGPMVVHTYTKSERMRGGLGSSCCEATSPGGAQVQPQRPS
mmetsp:Transcript_12969/g.22163  ORF Transcript_12969/g.22163 Transcript_12969/m.22163 type:complete len:306 (+) Transcript_12969:58-975(+)